VLQLILVTTGFFSGASLVFENTHKVTHLLQNPASALKPTAGASALKPTASRGEAQDLFHKDKYVTTISDKADSFTVSDVSRCTLQDVATLMPAGSHHLHAYLSNIYGVSDVTKLENMSQAWSWWDIGIIYPNLLHPTLQNQCKWHSIDEFSPKRNDIFQGQDPFLFVYKYDETSCEVKCDEGGDRNHSQVVPGRWIEVTHTIRAVGQAEENCFWTYYTPGSGNWLWTGPTLQVADHSDLSLLQESERREFREQHPEIESVEYLDHLDCSPITKDVEGCLPYFHELVTMRDGSDAYACPPDNQMAGGWEHEGSCRCDESYWNGLPMSLVKC